MAVILDGYSRKVVGWELGKTLAVRLALAALNKALVERNPGPGLVHHSDRGLQYASSEYVTAAALGIGLPSSGSGELSECNPSVFQTMTNTRDKFSGGGGDVALSPRSPASSGDGKKTQRTASVPTENCLTTGCSREKWVQFGSKMLTN